MSTSAKEPADVVIVADNRGLTSSGHVKDVDISSSNHHKSQNSSGLPLNFGNTSVSIPQPGVGEIQDVKKVFVESSSQEKVSLATKRNWNPAKTCMSTSSNEPADVVIVADNRGLTSSGHVKDVDVYSSNHHKAQNSSGLPLNFGNTSVSISQPGVGEIQDVKKGSLNMQPKKLTDAMKMKRHWCLDCGKSYTKHSNLKRHQRNHNENLRLHCSMCTQTFARTDKLQCHMKFIHERRGKTKRESSSPEKVSLATKRNWNPVKTRMSTSSNEPADVIIVADNRGLTSSGHVKDVDVSSSNHHKTQNSSGLPLNFGNTSDSISQPGVGEIHDVKKGSLNMQPKKLTDAMKMKRHWCLDCGKSYTKHSNLKRHQRNHNENLRLHCSMCTQTFARTDKLQCHMKFIHKRRGKTKRELSLQEKPSLVTNQNHRHTTTIQKSACAEKPADDSGHPISDQVTGVDDSGTNHRRTHNSSWTPTNNHGKTSISPSQPAFGDIQDVKTGLLIVGSPAITDEVKEEKIEAKLEIKAEPEETTPSTDDLEALLEIVPFIKRECPEMYRENVDSRQHNTEIPNVGDSWDQNNCTLNCSDDDGNGFINSTSPEVENPDKGVSCNIHESSIANTTSTEKRIHLNSESVNVEASQLASSKRQPKDEEKALTKKTSSEIYSFEHSENIFCKCIECLVKFKEIRCVKPDCPREKCPLCFKSVKFLRTHDCSGVRRHSCTVCNRAFATRRYLKNHVRHVHEGERDNFICAVCNKVYHYKSSLRCHIQTHSKELEKVLESPRTCELCQKVLINKNSYNKHKSRCHSGVQHVCSECSKVFKCKQELRDHVKEVHLMIQKIKCDLCYARLWTEEGLKKHKEKHHPSNEVNKFKNYSVCEVCGKLYKDKQRLEDHMNIHKGIKPYMCTDCGKGFRTYTNLAQHSRTHSDKRPFVCDLCGKGFRIRNHLRQHMAVHGLNNTSVKRKRKQSKFHETESESDLDD